MGRDLEDGDYVVSCPKCESMVKVEVEDVHGLVLQNAVKPFLCVSCGHSCEIVIKKQHSSTFRVFFSSGNLRQYPFKS